MYYYSIKKIYIVSPSYPRVLPLREHYGAAQTPGTKCLHTEPGNRGNCRLQGACSCAVLNFLLGILA